MTAELRVIEDQSGAAEVREHVGRLLADRPEQRVVLNVRRDAEPTQAAYETWGYNRAASVVPWQDAPVYDVMLRDLT